MSGSVLIVDDDSAIRTVVAAALKREGHRVTTAASIAELRRALASEVPDVLVTDVVLPDGNGLDVAAGLAGEHPELPIIVFSAQNTLATAVRATEVGAFDYLPKPFDLDVLAQAVRGAIARRQRQPAELAEAEVGGGPSLIGRSPAMQEVYRVIARVVSNDLTVLISGESGTGKELVAQAIHEMGPRRRAPFVALNMAAIPRELIEAELFGHERGAFTGAATRVAGKFEQAAGGTLFLDEIGDMPMDAQTRLLRVLQSGEFTTVGGARTIRADVRIVAATNKDLPARWRRALTAFYRRNNIVAWVEIATLAAALAILVASYFIVTSEPATDRLLSPAIVALLLISNLVPGVALLVLIGRRIAKKRAARSLAGGGGRLHVRLVALFSLIAAVPTLLVVIFASLLFQYGVEFWFSDRARGMLENASILAQETYAQNRDDVQGQTVTMASDLIQFLQEAPIENPLFQEAFARQVYQRELSEAAILVVKPGIGLQTLIMVDPYDRGEANVVKPEVMEKIRRGAPAVVTETSDRIEAVVPLGVKEEAYLWAARVANPKMLAQAQRADVVLQDYKRLLSRSRALQLQFNIALLVVSLLIVGAAVFIALTVADRLVRPLGDLVDGAHLRRHHPAIARSAPRRMVRRGAADRARDQEPAHADPARRRAPPAPLRQADRRRGGRVRSIDRHDHPPGRRSAADGRRILVVRADAQAAVPSRVAARHRAAGDVPPRSSAPDDPFRARLARGSAEPGQ
jgi:CheY-like chemotaxis protein